MKKIVYGKQLWQKNQNGRERQGKKKDNSPPIYQEEESYKDQIDALLVDKGRSRLDSLID